MISNPIALLGQVFHNTIFFGKWPSQKYLAVVPNDLLFCLYYTCISKLCGSSRMWHQFLSLNTYKVCRDLGYKMVTLFFFFFLQSKPKWTYLTFCLLFSTPFYSKLAGSGGVIVFFNLHIEWPYWLDSTSVWLWEYPRGKNRALHTDSISAVVWLIRNPAMSTTDSISTIPFSPAFPI